MKISFLITTLLTFLCLQTQAQTTCNSWAKSGGGIDDDGFPSGVAAFDGKAYFAGKFTDLANFEGQSLNANGRQGLFLNEYTADGDLVWSKVIATGWGFFGFKTIAESGGNLYLLGSSSEIYRGNDSLVGSNVFLIKLDTAGTVLWHRFYDSDGASSQFLGATADGNGGLFLSGRVRGTLNLGTASVSTNRYKTLLAHIDGTGNVLWAQGSNETVTGKPCRANSIALSPNGNLIVSGYYNDSLSIGNNVIHDPIGGSIGKSEMWLGAFDQNGNNLWLKGQTTSSQISLSAFDVGYGVATDANDNIYLVGGVSDTTDFFGIPLVATTTEPVVAKFDPTGTITWVQRCTPTATVGLDGLGVFTSVQVTAADEPMVSGWLNDNCTIGGQSFSVNAASDFCAGLFDGTGNLIHFDVFAGGDLYENTYASDLDTDDHLYIAGASSSKSLTLVPGNTLTNANQVATDTIPDAVIFKVCDGTLSATAPVGSRLLECKVFPNPTNGAFIFSASGMPQDARLQVTDLVGRIVLQEQLPAGISLLEIDAQRWQTGLYTWKVMGAESVLALGKISLLR